MSNQKISRLCFLIDVLLKQCIEKTLLFLNFKVQTSSTFGLKLVLRLQIVPLYNYVLRGGSKHCIVDLCVTSVIFVPLFPSLHLFGTPLFLSFFVRFCRLSLYTHRYSNTPIYNGWLLCLYTMKIVFAWFDQGLIPFSKIQIGVVIQQQTCGPRLGTFSLNKIFIQMNI